MKNGFYRIELNNRVWEVPEKYQSLEPIDSGLYGQVCSAIDISKNLKVVIKKMTTTFDSVIYAKKTYREIKLLKHIKHDNVIGLDGFAVGCNSPATTIDDFQNVYLVTNFMDTDLILAIKIQRLIDDHVQFLIYQILRGLKRN